MWTLDRARGMTPWLEALAAKFNGPSLIPGIYMMKEEKRLLTVVLRPPHTLRHVNVCTDTRRVNVIKT